MKEQNAVGILRRLVANFPALLEDTSDGIHSCADVVEWLSVELQVQECLDSELRKCFARGSCPTCNGRMMVKGLSCPDCTKQPVEVTA